MYCFCFVSETPTIFVPLVQISTNFGAQIKLFCTVNSTLPITIVYWERIINGVLSRVNHGTVGTDGINANNPSLTIFHSTSADSGFYTCFAGNAVGINYSSPINVTVVGGKLIRVTLFPYHIKTIASLTLCAFYLLGGMIDIQ